MTFLPVLPSTQRIARDAHPILAECFLYSIIKLFSFSSTRGEISLGWQEVLFLIILPQHLPPRLVESVSSSSGSGKHLDALTDASVKSLFTTKRNIFQGKRLPRSSLKVLQLEDIMDSLQYFQRQYGTRAAWRRLSSPARA